MPFRSRDPKPTESDMVRICNSLTTHGGSQDWLTGTTRRKSREEIPKPPESAWYIYGSAERQAKAAERPSATTVGDRSDGTSPSPLTARQIRRLISRAEIKLDSPAETHRDFGHTTVEYRYLGGWDTVQHPGERTGRTAENIGNDVRNSSDVRPASPWKMWSC